MDEQIRQEAVAAAQQLLLRYKAAHPGWTDSKTPIDEIASWLGLDVEYFQPNDYPDGTYGFLEPGEDLIWLCRSLSEALRRFTLAHELGHVMLHSDTMHARLWSRARVEMTSLPHTYQHLPELAPEDACQHPDVQEEVVGQNGQELLQEILGIGQSYNPRGERELAANIFAAELLMPIEQVRTLYLRALVPPHQLASLFAVSNAAMLNRLVGLATEPTTITIDTASTGTTGSDQASASGLQTRGIAPSESTKLATATEPGLQTRGIAPSEPTTSATATEPGRPQGSPLPYTNPTPPISHNDNVEPQPDHGRGDPLWSPWGGGALDQHSAT